MIYTLFETNTLWWYVLLAVMSLLIISAVAYKSPSSAIYMLVLSLATIMLFGDTMDYLRSAFHVRQVLYWCGAYMGVGIVYAIGRLMLGGDLSTTAAESVVWPWAALNFAVTYSWQKISELRKK